MTTCDLFERWLDEGRAEPGAAAMTAHAAGCARCRRALAAEAALASALAVPPAARAPAGFTEAVLARALAARPAAPARPARPWWRLALPWLPALGLCAAGAAWAAWLAWEGLRDLPATPLDPGPVLEVLEAPAAGGAALEAQLEAWLLALQALPQGEQAVVTLALSAALTAASWWLLRRVEARALGRARA